MSQASRSANMGRYADNYENRFEIGAVRLSLGTSIRGLRRQYLSLCRDF